MPSDQKVLDIFSNLRATAEKSSREGIRAASQLGFAYDPATVDTISEDLASVREQLDHAEKTLRLHVTNRAANLANFSDIAFVSVGEDCFSRSFVTRWGYRPAAALGAKSLPFDISIHPAETTLEILQNDFEDYLDPDRYAINDKGNCIIWKTGGVSYNHERDPSFSENNFELLLHKYKARIENFRAELATSPKLCFIIHPRGNKGNIIKRSTRIHHFLGKQLPKGTQYLTVLIDTTIAAHAHLEKRAHLLPENFYVIDEPYPSEDYNWSGDFLTNRGLDFEYKTNNRLREILDGWKAKAA